MDYELSKRYFWNQPKKGVSPALVALLAFIGGASVGSGIGNIFAAMMNSSTSSSSSNDNSFLIALAVGLVVGIIAAFIGYAVAPKDDSSGNNIVTDQQYDANVKKALADIREKALAALGVDESEVSEIAPISFEGYAFDDTMPWYKKGADGKYRSNKYRIVYIMFSANEAHIFKYTFSTTMAKTNQETEVYFYKDIVSVSTSSEKVEIGKGGTANTKIGKANPVTIETEFFKLTTSGGTSLSVSIHDTENAQRSINAMRALLREKKQG